jgi:two-component system NarL family response regulator
MDEASAYDRSPLDFLTERETDVLRELCVGVSNREIGNRLFISENTVKNYIHKILKKLHVSNRGEAVRLAKVLGLQ